MGIGIGDGEKNQSADFWEIILSLIAIKLVKSIQVSQNKLTKKTIPANTFARES